MIKETPLNLEGYKITLAERQEAIIKAMENVPNTKLSIKDKAAFIFNTLWRLRELKDMDDPKKARKNIGTLVEKSMKNLENRCITFKFIGFDKENLNKLEDTSISVGNHTASGIEAFYAHAMLPLNTRIVVKKALVEIPFSIGDGFKATDPIVMIQGTQTGVTREILTTCKDGKRVHIFPEGTRSKDGGLLDFQGLEGLVKISKKFDKNTIAVITTDSYTVLSFSTDNFFRGSARKGEIRFYLDFVDIDDKKPEEVEEEIRSKILSRLNESILQRERNLGIVTAVDKLK